MSKTTSLKLDFRHHTLETRDYDGRRNFPTVTSRNRLPSHLFKCQTPGERRHYTIELFQSPSDLQGKKCQRTIVLRKSSKKRNT